MIARAELQAMFDNIAKDAGWDMTRPMLWGYFFTATEREPLERAAKMLEEQGYRFVEIFESDPDEDDPELWWLHVSRVEAHSVDTLEQRNAALYRLAEELGLESYDGMDVCPSPPPN